MEEQQKLKSLRKFCFVRFFLMNNLKSFKNEI